MKLIEAVGIRLSGLIQEKGFTVYKLAKTAGMGCSTVWKILNPDLTSVKTLKLDTLYQIVVTMGISLSEFFDDPIFDEVTD